MEEYRPVQQQRWYPYTSNGGTILAIAGEDFSVLASDTRLSEGFQIYTRDSPKAYKLSDGILLGSCGFHGDVLTVTKNIKAQMKIYEHEHQKVMSCGAVAQLVATMFYHRRFFPFYTDSIIVGLDKEGKGCIFSFDPVGSYEREQYRAGGSASSMLQPLLDNQIGYKNQEGVDPEPLSKEKAVTLIKDVFMAAAERDIYTGDSLKIHIITAGGVEERDVPLRRD